MNSIKYKGVQPHTAPNTYEKDFEKLLKALADITNVVTVQADNLNKMYKSLGEFTNIVAEQGKRQERLVSLIENLSLKVEDVSKGQEALNDRITVLESSMNTTKNASRESIEATVREILDVKLAEKAKPLSEHKEQPERSLLEIFTSDFLPLIRKSLEIYLEKNVGSRAAAPKSAASQASAKVDVEKTMRKEPKVAQVDAKKSDGVEITRMLRENRQKESALTGSVQTSADVEAMPEQPVVSNGGLAKQAPKAWENYPMQVDDNVIGLAAQCKGFLDKLQPGFTYMCAPKVFIDKDRQFIQICSYFKVDKS